MNFAESQFLRTRQEVRSRSPIYLPPVAREFDNLNSSLFSFNTYRRLYSPALQPRGGLSTPNKQYLLWKVLQKSGADILPLTIDSNTRQNDYRTASELAKQAAEMESDTLNGYPLLSIDLSTTQDIIQNINQPISLRHGTPDARLLVEAALSAGIYEIEGGGISYLFPYSKSYPLDMCLANWRYVDRLCAFYNRNEAPVIRESFAPLTSTLVHPIISSLVQILELAMAAREGVKYFSVSISQTGNLAQDLATYQSLRRLVSWVCESFLDIQITTFFVYHQWMGAFPFSRVKADQLLSYANITAMLMNCDKLILKTRDEALGVPSAEANSDACKAALYTRDMFSLTSLNLSSPDIEEEVERMFRQGQHLFKKVVNNNHDDIYERVSVAFRSGMIDIPFSPHISNIGLHSCRRSADGSIRVFNPGKIPFTDCFLERERDLLKPQYSSDPVSIDSTVKMILHFADLEDLL